MHSPTPSDHTPATSKTPLIELDDFCFAYDEIPVLRHVNLQIAQGEAVALMGDNGSGKSTLLRALVGLHLAQQGSYLLDGQEVNDRSMRDTIFAKRLHQRMGFVFQDSDSQLFCASVYDEIAFGPRQMGLNEQEVTQRTTDVMALLDIARLAERAPWTLSGGEKKRVALACILSMNPDVLLLDEPLAGLDAKTRDWLTGFLGQLRAAGKTLVIATHEGALADALGCRIVAL